MVERLVYTEDVGSSTLSSPTISLIFPYIQSISGGMVQLGQTLRHRTHPVRIRGVVIGGGAPVAHATSTYSVPPR